MPGPLVGELVATRVTKSCWCAGGGVEVSVVPAVGVVLQLVDVLVVGPVGDVLAAPGHEDVAMGIAGGCRSAGGGAEVALVPAVGVVPQFVDVHVAGSPV